MADITVTVANVQQSSSAKIKTGTAAEAITAGQAVRRTSTGIALSQADDAATAGCDGIAVNNAAAGQPVSYVTEDGSFNPGATVVAGTVYVVSAAAAGGIAPLADLTTGHVVTPVGVATGAAAMKAFPTEKLAGAVVP